VAAWLTDALARDPQTAPRRYQAEPGLAEAILHTAIDADVDMAYVRQFPNEVLLAHAFGPVLRVIDPEARIPVVPVFVNAIHHPAPSARRCYAYGQALRKAVESHPGAERVVVYASGGMSHFTAGVSSWTTRFSPPACRYSAELVPGPTVGPSGGTYIDTHQEEFMLGKMLEGRQVANELLSR
jgi:hypothetical protein